MKKGLIKAGVLLGILVVAIVIMEIIFSESGEDLTVKMKGATLPVVYFEQNGKEINPLYGYTSEMEPQFTRDSITPLDDNLSLDLRVNTYGQKVKEINYQIRTLDSARLVEDTVIEKYTQNGDTAAATLSVKNLLDNNAEYQLVINLKMENQVVHYYTRIMIPKDTGIAQCVDFANSFHEKTFDKSNTGELNKYMEPDSGKKTNSSLNYTTIHSSVKQLCWDSFKPQQVGNTEVSIKEIKKEYSVIILSYVISRTGANEEPEYYNVEEYYRIRYGIDRMFLLDFERNVNQIFNENGDNFTENAIKLGVRSGDVNYINNETGTIVGFVQQGDLWEYNSLNDSISKVFSFREDMNNMDRRENNRQHSIRIIRIDETGSMDFIVYGYMCRGSHEGKVGISVFHYDCVTNDIEEQIWIPYTKSYQMMEQVVGKVLYVNDHNQLFYMSEGTIYQVDLSTRKEEAIAKGSGDEWFAVSEDNSMLAWVEGGNANAGTTLHLYNMAEDEQREIKAAKGEYIRPLGFIGTDLIYGDAKKSQVVTGSSGVTVFPMYDVKIMDEEGKVKKNYQKSGRYVVGISIENFTITLDRVKYSDGSYVSTTPDTIMNMLEDGENVAKVQTIGDGEKQNVVAITVASEIDDNTPNFLATKLVSTKENRTLEVKCDGDEKYYYAYAKGKVVKITPKESEAVQIAAKETGVVVDGSAQYVWQQAKSAYVNTFGGMSVDTSKVGNNYVERALCVILKKEGVTLSVGELLDNGKTAKGILESSISGVTVLDLSGCKLEQMLYYVSQGSPVYAMVSSSKPVLICGYSKDKITVYDPAKNDTKTYSMEQAEKMFKKAGNVFLTYIKRQQH